MNQYIDAMALMIRQQRLGLDTLSTDSARELLAALIATLRDDPGALNALDSEIFWDSTVQVKHALSKLCDYLER